MNVHELARAALLVNAAPGSVAAGGEASVAAASGASARSVSVRELLRENACSVCGGGSPCSCRRRQPQGFTGKEGVSQGDWKIIQSYEDAASAISRTPFFVLNGVPLVWGGKAFDALGETNADTAAAAAARFLNSAAASVHAQLVQRHRVRQELRMQLLELRQAIAETDRVCCVKQQELLLLQETAADSAALESMACTHRKGARRRGEPTSGALSRVWDFCNCCHSAKLRSASCVAEALQRLLSPLLQHAVEFQVEALPLQLLQVFKAALRSTVKALHRQSSSATAVASDLDAQLDELLHFPQWVQDQSIDSRVFLEASALDVLCAGANDATLLLLLCMQIENALKRAGATQSCVDAFRVCSS
ncbi:kinesin motor domain-containing protein [Cyclospora cayetanensis]|uniref:Kinesin motor domain-containing protein n=1 Tax=Cyclospora cayetanensis TaxID=88456 RepID=A0A1D3D7L2_9EIME|nr:kinesin motor domain-containing protein [Cyclospora cayetanensis]